MIKKHICAMRARLYAAFNGMAFNGATRPQSAIQLPRTDWRVYDRPTIHRRGFRVV